LINDDIIYYPLFYVERKSRKRQTTWEQQRLYNIKNPLMGKAAANPYGTRGLPNGHSTSTYSTGDGVGWG